MAFSTAEIQQIKHFLGYGNLTASARPYFDIAIVFEEVIQNNTDTNWAEGYVRNTILANLLQLDIDIMDQRTRRQVSVLEGEAVLNHRELQDLLDLKGYWVEQLSSTLKVPIAQSCNGIIEVL